MGKPYAYKTAYPGLSASWTSKILALFGGPISAINSSLVSKLLGRGRFEVRGPEAEEEEFPQNTPPR
jgi:hypothetical protein